MHDPGRYDRIYRDDDPFIHADDVVDAGDAGSVGACDACGVSSPHQHTHSELGFPVNVEEEADLPESMRSGWDPNTPGREYLNRVLDAHEAEEYEARVNRDWPDYFAYGDAIVAKMPPAHKETFSEYVTRMHDHTGYM